MCTSGFLIDESTHLHVHCNRLHFTPHLRSGVDSGLFDEQLLFAFNRSWNRIFLHLSLEIACSITVIALTKGIMKKRSCSE